MTKIFCLNKKAEAEGVKHEEERLQECIKNVCVYMGRERVRAR